MRKSRGQIPLWSAIVLATLFLIVVILWTRQQTSPQTTDGRETIVLWGHVTLGDEMYTLVHRFEQRFPQYKVIMSTSAARDLTGDAQCLPCAIAGGVPSEVVFFY